MNKRIKKKQIKRALNNMANGKMTKRDLHVIRTFGRKEFADGTGFDVETLPAAIEEAKRTITKLIEAFTEVLKPIVAAVNDMFRKGEFDETKNTIPENTIQKKEVQEQKGDH